MTKHTYCFRTPIGICTLACRVCYPITTAGRSAHDIPTHPYARPTMVTWSQSCDPKSHDYEEYVRLGTKDPHIIYCTYCGHSKRL